MSKDNGGPAFHQPDAISNELHPNYGRDIGMTLRDYFAAKSIPMATAWEESHPTYGVEGPTYRGIAERAYLLADSMLEARK